MHYETGKVYTSDFFMFAKKSVSCFTVRRNTIVNKTRRSLVKIREVELEQRLSCYQLEGVSEMFNPKKPKVFEAKFSLREIGSIFPLKYAV